MKNSVILPGVEIGKDVHVENQVVDKNARLIRMKEIVSDPDNPGYVKRSDIL